jgi:hypothetical protein
MIADKNFMSWNNIIIQQACHLFIPPDIFLAELPYYHDDPIPSTDFLISF